MLCGVFAAEYLLGKSMRALIPSLVVAVFLIGCAHDRGTARDKCPKCGTTLFFAVPQATSAEEIRAFARGSKLRDRDEIISTGWVHPGAYCPNGDYEIYYNFKTP